MSFLKIYRRVSKNFIDFVSKAVDIILSINVTGSILDLCMQVKRNGELSPLQGNLTNADRQTHFFSLNRDLEAQFGRLPPLFLLNSGRRTNHKCLNKSYCFGITGVKSGVCVCVCSFPGSQHEDFN